MTQKQETPTVELPGMPAKTELDLMGEAWVNQKMAIKENQETLEEIAEHVMKAMRKAGRDTFKVRAHGEIFCFDIVDTTKLKVTKA